MTSSEAFELARRKARYGHRDWVVYRRRDGSWSAAQYSAAAIKAAMLEMGTAGHFSLIAASTGIGHRYNWPMGCLAIRNARFLAREYP